MKNLPANPHAIVEIERPGKTDGQGSIRYDSWTTPRLFSKVDVELSTNQSSEARVTFFDPKFFIIDAFSDATAKAVVRVYLGYGQDLGEPVFKGILAQVERGDANTTLIIYDMAFVMKLLKTSGYKNKKDDLAIIRGLVTRNKTPEGNALKFEGPEKPLKLERHDAMIGDEITDWEWMAERAQDSGLVYFVRGDTVFAKYPAKTGTPTMTIENRKDFTMLSGWDFTYRTPENQDGRAKAVKHRRRNRKGRFVTGTSLIDQHGHEETVIKRDMPHPSKKKLSARARAQKELEREHAFEGRVETAMPIDGTRLDVRDTVSIKGVGKLFSGDYLSNSVAYRFGAGKLNLELQLYRDIKE